MNKNRLLVLACLPIFALTCCQTQNSSKKTDENVVAFTANDKVQSSFGGLGVEWGTYEDTDKLVEGGWDTIIRHMDHLGASRIRLMTNYDWFCQNFDDKGTKDKNDDTWTYNFANKYAYNMFDILDYCEINHIDVAFGAWNVIANLSGVDEWGMMEDVTSDIRWAKISVDFLDFLVNKKGYTCIKWFVNSNEPNYTGIEGRSKNYNNTYEKWEQGVKNVRQGLDSIGLNNIGIVGGDTTGLEGTKEYFFNIAKNIPDKVADYGCHLYLSNIAIDRGELYQRIDEIYSELKQKDTSLGVSKQANIWEAGLLDGKTTLDSQSLIHTTNYAVRMVDYTIQCISAGVNGIVYWDFDDAMHFMYTENTMTPKEWGMFSSLADANSKKQELRPWYHSTSLLCHLMEKGNKIYSVVHSGEQPEATFRTLCSVSQDNKKGGYFAVNTGGKAVTKSFYIEEKIEGDKLYIYYFNENGYRLDENGYIVPNEVIDGSLNKKLTMEIPSGSAIFVSNERL